MDEVALIETGDVIELNVPIYQFEEYINTLFGEGEFLQEYQYLEIKDFSYNEGEGLFHFTLHVTSKEIN